MSRIYYLLFLWLTAMFAQPLSGEVHFLQGVASGDPLTDRVIIWTRITPDDNTTNYMVNWRVAKDTGMVEVVAEGVAMTDSNSFFTIKADVTGLSADTWYYYDFRVDTTYSIRGRTRTLPSGNLDNFRIGVFTCSNFQESYYELYDHASRRNDLDLIFHLGDYIYEKKPQDQSLPDRLHEPPVKLHDLWEFRERYLQYRSDTNLIRAHQQYPWILTWDDHEVAGDSWQFASDSWEDSASHMPVKRAATKAYLEWMPIRVNEVVPSRIYREFKLGNLLDIIVLDTRHEGRIKQTDDFDASMNDSGRTILGNEQFIWLKERLLSSTAKWKVIANQVIMMPLQLFGVGIVPDVWDGYSWERDSLLKFIAANDIKNVVVTTGDVHRTFCGDLPQPGKPYNPANGNNSVGVELVTPAISSEADEQFSPLLNLLLSSLVPHLIFTELQRDGYLVLDLRADKAQGDYYYIRNNRIPNGSIFWGKSLFTNNGNNHLKFASQPIPPLTSYPPLAPLWPIRELTTILITNNTPVSTLTIFPNPGKEFTGVYIALPTFTESVRIYDVQGRLVFEQIKVPAGIQFIATVLSVGTYQIVATLGKNILSNTLLIQ